MRVRGGGCKCAAVTGREMYGSVMHYWGRSNLIIRIRYLGGGGGYSRIIIKGP